VDGDRVVAARRWLARGSLGSRDCLHGKRHSGPFAPAPTRADGRAADWKIVGKAT
jgi:hypothetical protein